jgi:hypothetical protein
VVIVYDKRIIISGDVIELYEYEKPRIKGMAKDERAVESAVAARAKNAVVTKKIKDLINNKEMTMEELLDYVTAEKLGEIINRREDNLNQTKRKLRRLINSNPQLDKFITFTFKKNEIETRDVQMANKEFGTFMKRLNRYNKKRGHGKVEYVCVVEYQQRGVVHYHVLSNIKYIRHEDLKDLWGHGNVDIKRIDKVDNVGAYVVKYIQKGNHDIRLRGEKAFFTSQQLKKPIEIADAKKIAQVLGGLEQCEVYSSTFETEYTGVIRYVQYNRKRNKIKGEASNE